MSNRRESIIYVNFIPYENAGYILDYILASHTRVLLITLSFHKLNKKQKSTVKLYENKKLIKTYSLAHLSLTIPLSLLFILVPLRSCINLVQIMWFAYITTRKYGTFDTYFTVNAFTAWVGILLKKCRLVNYTIFWVWDYYPPLHANKIIQFMRWLYWQFDKYATIHSDSVVFLNQRLIDLRKDINILPIKKKYSVVSIGTNPLTSIPKKFRTRKKYIVGFLGVIKKSQGLDVFLDIAPLIKKEIPNVEFQIIGSGPDLEYFKARGRKCPIKTIFYGYVQDHRKVRKIQSNWSVGLALYIPDESNVSYYTDTSKIKDYLSLGIPVISTNVSSAKEVSEKKAGVIVDYYRPDTVLHGLVTLRKNLFLYKKNALKLSRDYYYKTAYENLI